MAMIVTSKQEDIKQRARREMERSGVLMTNGHFDYGNGYHGRVYLNPHQLFQHPSTIWRAAQDLLDLLPTELIAQTHVVAGPPTGGALLAHTIAGLIDGRRALSHPPCSFAPFVESGDMITLRPFYAGVVKGRNVLLADDVRNTGKTLERCADAIRAAGGILLASVQIYDRMEAVVDLGVPNVALVEYQAPENHPAAVCPMCASGEPVTRF